MTSKVIKGLFLQNIICITPDLKIKKLFKNVNIMKTQILHNMKYEIQGHIRPLLCQNPSSTFVYGLILMKILMNANIMKIQLFHKIVYDLKCHFYVMKKFFTLRPFDLITIDLRSYGNFCPCFI